jgi:dienelactone hydrolase
MAAALLGGRLEARRPALLHAADDRNVSDRPVLLLEPVGTDGSVRLRLTIPGELGVLAGVGAQGVAVSVSILRNADGAQTEPAGMLARRMLESADGAGSLRLLEGARPGGAGTLVVLDGRRTEARAFDFRDGVTALAGPGDPVDNIPAPGLSTVREAVIRTGEPLAAGTRPSPPSAQFDPSSLERLRRLRRAVSDLKATPLDETVRRLAGVPGDTIMAAPLALLPVEQALVSAGHGGDHAAIQLPAALRSSAEGAALAGRLLRRSEGTATPGGDRRPEDAELPDLYRLTLEPFRWEMEPLEVTGGTIRRAVRFPSPVVTDHECNNTVHAEFFRPAGPGPFPTVIALHIAGGDFELSRLVCRLMAEKGIAGLFIKMPYYGERRPQGVRVRMISNDLERGLGAVRQTVLDIRRAVDWLEQQPEVDRRRIGIMGISLGAIMGSLACAQEPRLTHACLVMGGGRLENVLFESVEKDAIAAKREWEKAGGTRESFAKVFGPYDPATYGERLSRRTVFMISAADDRTIPPVCSFALWDAAGRQRILWYPCGHYTIVRHFIPAIGHLIEFFREWPDRRLNVPRMLEQRDAPRRP